MVRLEPVAELLNVEPHMIYTAVNRIPTKECVMSQRVDASILIDLLVKQLEKERVYAISQFIANF